MNKNKEFKFEKFKEKIIKSGENYDLYNTKNLLKRYLAWERLITTKKLTDKVNGSRNISVDFGCQRGFVTTHLCLKYNQVFGVDIDKKALKIAKKVLMSEGFKNFYLINNEPNEIKIDNIKKETVDLIVCNDVLEHVSDLKGIILEFKRILKKNGHLIISIPTENLIYKLGNFIDFYFGFSKKIRENGHINNQFLIRKELLNNFELLESKNIFYCFWLALLKAN
jgi:2-polyprenyl-3-methyl-5-hydroxy-6-metoxy-1,4-benzoquinol methylase